VKLEQSSLQVHFTVDKAHGDTALWCSNKRPRDPSRILYFYTLIIRQLYHQWHWRTFDGQDAMGSTSQRSLKPAVIIKSCKTGKTHYCLILWGHWLTFFSARTY